jgi:hypothetical protein
VVSAETAGIAIWEQASTSSFDLAILSGGSCVFNPVTRLVI